MNNKLFSFKCDETLYLQKMYKIDFLFFFFRFWAFFLPWFALTSDPSESEQPDCRHAQKVEKSERDVKK